MPFQSKYQIQYFRILIGFIIKLNSSSSNKKASKDSLKDENYDKIVEYLQELYEKNENIANPNDISEMTDIDMPFEEQKRYRFDKRFRFDKKKFLQSEKKIKHKQFRYD